MKKILILVFTLTSFSSFGATGKQAVPQDNLSNESYPTGGLLKRRSNDLGGKDLLQTEQSSSRRQDLSGKPAVEKKALDMKKGYVDRVSDMPADEVFDAALSQGKTQTGPYDTTAPAPEAQAEEAPAE